MVRCNVSKVVFVVVVSVTAALALGADTPDKVQRAVNRLFADKQADVQPRREINGVKTYEASIATSDGGTDRKVAVITENGDILLSSQRRTDGAPTPSVQRVAEGLFNMPMNEYQAVTQTLYLINVESDGQPYQLRLDATGRIRDAASERDLRLEDVSNLQKASGGDRDAAAGFVKKWNEGAQVGEVYQYQPISNYYLVEYATPDGEKSQIVLNKDGRVYLEITEFSQDKLPRAVRATLDDLFKDAKIGDVARANMNYYQFERSVGDDTLTLKIRPNGDVLQVVSEQAEDDERAVTASERQRQGNGNREGREKDRDRANNVQGN
jgi:hypothetical protein